MKTVVLCGITLLAVAPALAQTSSQPSGEHSKKTVTLAGCVGGGSDSKPITLSQALIVPDTAQPGQVDPTPSPVPPPVSSAETQPDPAAPNPIGTSGVKTPSSGGIVSGTAPAGSSASSVSGYRLSGTDMQPWIGQRVQMVGTFVPAPATAAATTAAPAATGAATAPPLLEFRVQSVQAASGPCPK